MARTAWVEEGCYIGAGTIISSNAVVRSSVIGRNCLVADGAVVEGCFLWNDVSVGAGAEVRHALLCDGVKVRPNDGRPGIPRCRPERGEEWRSAEVANLDAHVAVIACTSNASHSVNASM